MVKYAFKNIYEPHFSVRLFYSQNLCILAQDFNAASTSDYQYHKGYFEREGRRLLTRFSPIFLPMEKLTKGQQNFMNAVAEGKNIFLTGKAGTGKSFVVNKAIQQLKDVGKSVISLAPTGIAANNIGGTTIHSTFAIPPFGVLKFDKCNFLSKASKKLLEKVQVIFIDEVSMLRPDTLDAMDWTLKKNGFQGLETKQIVFVGDMKQIPPVLDKLTEQVLLSNYKSVNFFDAKIYSKIGVEQIELTEILRQSDTEFIDALNNVRNGVKEPYFKKFISDKSKGIILCPHNETAYRYNEIGLSQLPSEPITLTSSIEGDCKPSEFNVDAQLVVKDGCKIMYLVNSKEHPLVNGTIGILRINIEEKKFFIETSTGTYEIKKHDFVKKKYVFDEVKKEIKLKEIGKIVQYPIKIAYAISIHKSQGMTFETATVDLSRRCFIDGQLYVALSRVKSPDGLKIIV